MTSLSTNSWLKYWTNSPNSKITYRFILTEEFLNKFMNYSLKRCSFLSSGISWAILANNWSETILFSSFSFSPNSTANFIRFVFSYSSSWCATFDMRLQLFYFTLVKKVILKDMILWSCLSGGQWVNFCSQSGLSAIWFWRQGIW